MKSDKNTFAVMVNVINDTNLITHEVATSRKNYQRKLLMHPLSVVDL